MEEMIFEFFKTYGWQLTLIACSGIFILGIFKCFHVFDKIKEDKRPYIYAIISTALSIGAAAVYLVIKDAFHIGAFAGMAVMFYLFNQGLYSAYETFGLRALVRKIGNAFIGCFKKTKEEKTNDTELTSEQLNDETLIK